MWWYDICNESMYNYINISEDTQKTPQSRSTALPRHQMKERWETNNDKTNATYETTDAQTKKNCNRGTALEQSVEKILC